MIRLVCVSLKSEDDALRLSTFEPRNRNKNDWSLITDGYKLSLDFNMPIETALRTFEYKPRRSVRLAISSIELDDQERMIIKTRLPQDLFMEVRYLGSYEERDVYAIVLGTCYAELRTESHTSDVAYRLDTIDNSLDRCADAEFYKNFLRAAVENFK